jgi:hypothetical protein
LPHRGIPIENKPASVSAVTAVAEVEKSGSGFPCGT